jgi:hypothetical protein
MESERSMSDRAERIARARRATHVAHGNYRAPIGAISGLDADTVGIAGEIAFADATGLALDDSARPFGDNGIDFVCVIGTVDVKTARKPYNLIVPQATPHFADVYVLAYYDDDTRRATLLGWEYVERVRKAPVRKFSDLREIDRLVHLIRQYHDYANGR